MKAVVLRIDSGGGNARASELIWRAVEGLKAKKPVVVSMSDVAASGGYYIAAGATRIFAHADTLTGSIGVMGGKLAPAGGLARLGVNAFPMGRGKRATMLASLAPWTDDERAVIQRSMEEVYRVFLERVAAGRGKQPAEIEPIAQGRVWTGERARELGLVDEIGGLDAALAGGPAAGQGGRGDGARGVPAGADAAGSAAGLGGLGGGGGLVGMTGVLGIAGAADLAGAPGAAAADAASAALTTMAAASPALAAQARGLVELALSFRASPVQAIAVLPLVR